MQELNISSSSGPDVPPTRSQLSELSTDKDSRRCPENPEVSSLLESEETESKTTKWTDEKHSLYLKSMEASFVNQLYNSLDMLGWSSHEEGSSEPKVSSQKHNRKGAVSPSGQYKVFRDGSWARINFRRETNTSANNCSILANPWIQHYKCSGRQGIRICPAFEERTQFANDSCLQLDCEDSVGSNAEVTDQNFVDEASEEEKSSRRRRNKCRKISKATCSGNDQVVPIENLSLIGDVVEARQVSKE